MSVPMPAGRARTEISENLAPRSRTAESPADIEAERKKRVRPAGTRRRLSKLGPLDLPVIRRRSISALRLTLSAPSALVQQSWDDEDED